MSCDPMKSFVSAAIAAMQKILLRISFFRSTDVQRGFWTHCHGEMLPPVMTILALLLTLGILANGFSHLRTIRQRFSAGGELAMDSDSGQAIRILKERFDLRNAHPIAICFTSDEPLDRRVQWNEVEKELNQLMPWALLQMPRFASDDMPQMSADGKTAVLLAHFSTLEYGPTELAMPSIERWERDFSARHDVQVNIFGMAPLFSAVKRDSMRELVGVELVGIPLTLLLLTLCFKNWRWACIVGLFSGISIVGTLGFLGVLMNYISVAHYALNTVIMLGFALTTDYALIWLYRFAEADHWLREESIRSANRTVIVGALTVISGFVALALVPHESLRSIAFAGMIVSALSTFLVVSFLPWLAVRVPLPRHGSRELWHRWSHWITRRAFFGFTGGVLILCMGMLFWRHFSSGIIHRHTISKKSVWRQAEQRLHEAIPTLPLEPILLVSEAPLKDDAKLKDAQKFAREIFQTDPLSVEMNLDIQAGVKSEVWLIRGGDDVKRVQKCIRRFRAEARVGGWPVHVTGPLANTTDIDDQLWRSIPRVCFSVLILNMIVLGLAFRSFVIPIKAIVLNTLVIGCTGGILCLLFCTKGGAYLMGTQQAVGLNAFAMVLLMATIFSLSMDYEVFLVSRMAEFYWKTGDQELAVKNGIVNTGPVVTRAGIIMMAVFVIFGSTNLFVIKQFGVGMAIAIFLDITVARLLMLPAWMRLLGRWNWWPGGGKINH